jgi:hypothetical protein
MSISIQCSEQIGMEDSGYLMRYSGLHDLYVLMPTASFQVGTSRFPGSYFYRQMALVPVPTWLENILA